jgi:hypothetical protein
MSDLIVIAFPTEAKAEEVRQKLLAMQKEYLIELGDAVIAVKDEKGHIKPSKIWVISSPLPPASRAGTAGAASPLHQTRELSIRQLISSSTPLPWAPFPARFGAP